MEDRLLKMTQHPQTVEFVGERIKSQDSLVHTGAGLMSEAQAIQVFRTIFDLITAVIRYPFN